MSHAGTETITMYFVVTVIGEINKVRFKACLSYSAVYIFESVLQLPSSSYSRDP